MREKVILSCLLLILVPAGLCRAAPLLFLSTQGVPAEEARQMRQVVLKGFPGQVDFQPFDDRATFYSLARNSGPEGPSLLGGLHSDMMQLAAEGELEDLGPLLPWIDQRHLSPNFLQLGHLGRSQLFYLPWMQATYIMVANRRALAYLPAGASLNSLSYAELSAWARNLQAETGSPMLGFPAGPNGLMHRFFQGYLYPSYTGTTVGGFRSTAAQQMWQEFRELWKFVTPRSLTFDSMHQALSSGEIWLAWDHTARILPALEKRPQDFVVFPAPAGPRGRGFMVVLAGLAIPRLAPQPQRARELIDYLSQPGTQLLTLHSLGFFPVLDGGDDQGLTAGLRLVKEAVTRQSAAPDAIPSLLPSGLGGHGQEFNLAYKLTFSRIVLRQRPIAEVLDSQAKKVRELLEMAGAVCWPPDAPSEGPCPVQ